MTVFLLIAQCLYYCILVVVVQSLSCVQLFATPWTAARQASLPFTISRSLLRLMCIELVKPSSVWRGKFYQLMAVWWPAWKELVDSREHNWEKWSHHKMWHHSLAPAGILCMESNILSTTNFPLVAHQRAVCSNQFYCVLQWMSPVKKPRSNHQSQTTGKTIAYGSCFVMFPFPLQGIFNA